MFTLYFSQIRYILNLSGIIFFFLKFMRQQANITDVLLVSITKRQNKL